MPNPLPLVGCVAIYPPVPVQVGTNLMTNVQFPLIVGDHYFHAYELDGRLVWDVFLWRPHLRCPIYEVRASLPVIEGGWEVGGGGVTFTALDEGDGFDLTLQPSPTNPETTMSIRIGDSEITVDSKGVSGAGVTMLDNVVMDCVGGFRFTADGGAAMGIGAPPDGMILVPTTTDGQKWR